MCARYSLNATRALLASQFGMKWLFSLEPRVNIAPTQTVVGVVGQPAGPEPHALLERRGREFRWGLMPPWARGEVKPAGIINARAETAATKSAFRSAFRQRRCLLPADGFYEWQTVSDPATGRQRKQPMQIRLKNGALMALAGLWEPWQAPDGQIIPTVAILTTEANDVVRPIHDRMPVILAPQDYDTWLDGRHEDMDALARLLAPYPAQEMEALPTHISLATGRRESENPSSSANTLWDKGQEGG